MKFAFCRVCCKAPFDLAGGMALRSDERLEGQSCYNSFPPIIDC